MVTKFRNIKTLIDGYTFDSKKESRHYLVLKARLIKGDITNLEVHPKFELRIGPVKICDYVADFSYYDGHQFVVEDVKSPATVTATYRLKEKLMHAILGIRVQRVGLPAKKRGTRKVAS